MVGVEEYTRPMSVISENITLAPRQSGVEGDKGDAKMMSGDEDVMVAPGIIETVDGQKKGVVTSDAVWGEVGDEGPNYRGLGWIRASVLETKTQIGLGVLGLASLAPAVLDTLGFATGLLVIIGMAIIITWTDLCIGQFKRNHPECYTMGDVGYLFFGRIGREIWGWAYLLMLVAVSAGGFLGFSIALNAVSVHGTCTVVFVAVGAIIVFFFASIQTLSRISWLGWVGVCSIFVSVVTLAIAVGVSDRPAAAPLTGPLDKDIRAFREVPFVDAMNAINIVLFAYCGTPNFMQIASEMRDFRDYSKSVYLCQGFVTVTYLVIVSVVYHFTGQYIASPALGSAGPLLKRVCYGIAIPGLLVGGMVNLHLPAKYVFVRLLGGTRHLSRNTPIHLLVWFSCVGALCVLAFIIAEAIPVFDDLLSIIGSIFATFLCIQTETFMWFYDNWRPATKSAKWYGLFVLNAVFNLIGWFIMGAGTYAAVVQIRNDIGQGNVTSPFSCADNSGST